MSENFFPSSSLSSSLPMDEGPSSRRIFRRGEDDDDDDDDEILSLSSDTSATSVASDISDGVTRRPSSSGGRLLQQRPRSISLGGGGYASHSTTTTSLSYSSSPLVVATTTNNHRTTSSAGRQRSLSITTNSSSGYYNNNRPLSNPRLSVGGRLRSNRRLRNNVSSSPLGIRPDTEEEERRDYEADREVVVENGNLPTVVVVAAAAATTTTTTTAGVVRGDYIIDSSNNIASVTLPPPPEAADSEGTVVLAVVLESVVQVVVDNIDVPTQVMIDNNVGAPPSSLHPQQQQQQQQRVHNATTTTTAPRVSAQAAGTLLRAPHRVVVVSSSSTTTTTTSRSTHPHNHHHHHRQADNSKSNKQHPSHRKLRRWDNDNFIGHPVAEGTHLKLIENDGSSSSSSNWKEYYMPNYPSSYRSSFAKLIHDKSDLGNVVRDKFYKGEVACGGMHLGRGGGGGGRNTTKYTMKECVIYRMRKLGLSSLLLVAHKEVETKKDIGRILYQQLLTSRIQSVLVQSCGISILENSSSSKMNEARAIVTAFESYIVSLAHVGYTTLQDKRAVVLKSVNNGDNNNNNDINNDVVVCYGYPPIQSKEIYEVLHKILSRPPKIIIKSTTIMPSTITPPSSLCGDSQQTMNEESTIFSSFSSSMTACWIPTVNFYFSADTWTTEDGGDSARSSAFHRILLYSVCQFHGLVVSSSTIDNSSSSGRKKTITSTNKRQGGKGESGKKNLGITEKVVTIQACVMLTPTLKLLDHII